MDRTTVVEVLEAAGGRGLVRRDHELNPQYRLTHPIIGRLSQTTAGGEQTARSNAGIAAELATRQTVSPSSASVRITRQFLAVGQRGPQTELHRLDAARWLLSAGSFAAGG